MVNWSRFGVNKGRRFERRRATSYWERGVRRHRAMRTARWTHWAVVRTQMFIRRSNFQFEFSTRILNSVVSTWCARSTERDELATGCSFVLSAVIHLTICELLGDRLTFLEPLSLDLLACVCRLLTNCHSKRFDLVAVTPSGRLAQWAGGGNIKKRELTYLKYLKYL